MEHESATPYPLIGEEKYATIKGLKIRYWIAGSGEPVILIHGLTGFLDYWSGTMSVLSKYFRVIAYDQPAHGLSDIPSSPFSPELFSDHLVGLMDYLQIPKATLVGHSLGGAISITTCLRMSHMVSKLVLVDSVSYPVRIHSWPAKLNFYILRMPLVSELVAGMPPSMANLKIVRKVAVYNQKVNTPDVLALHLRFGSKPGFMSYVASIAQNWNKLSFYTSRAGEINVPTLLIWGENDRFVPQKYGMYLADRIPKSRYIMIPKCGHEPFAEKPEVFYKALLDFLKQDEG